MDRGKQPSKACAWGKKTQNAWVDNHSACAPCLVLQHAQDALASLITCEDCVSLSIKTYRYRLVHQASLSAVDTMVVVAIPLLQELEENTQGNTSPWETAGVNNLALLPQ